MRFGSLPASEIERRRAASIEALKQIRTDEFERKYQERCDTRYWKDGRCCAGCDHWASEGGDIGECGAAPLVSGTDVIRSLGISWSSYTPPPGQPYTQADHVCGAFKDDFDWPSLPIEYLKRIGAAQAIEARRAATGTGAVHESAVGETDAPNPTPETSNAD